MSTESIRFSFKRERDGTFLIGESLSTVHLFLCLYFLKNKKTVPQGEMSFYALSKGNLAKVYYTF